MDRKRRQHDQIRGKARKCQKESDQKEDPKVSLQEQVTEGITDTVPCVSLPLSSGESTMPSNIRLSRTFFDVPCIDLARALLGQSLVRMIGSHRVSGRIIETEAYLGLEDKAAHSYSGKRTGRNEAMFMEPGTAYVYNIYGIYCCLNISSQGDGCAVLLRALEPLENIEVMKVSRANRSGKKQKDKEMTNGPSKLCQALKISKQEFNQSDLSLSPLMWLEKGDDIPSDKIVCCPRINIAYAEDWIQKPLRFYVFGNGCVSLKDKAAEEKKVKAICVDQ